MNPTLSIENVSLRTDAIRKNPDFPWLDPEREEELGDYLATAGFLEQNETILRCTQAGDGNMNLTLWIETSSRQFILKQARPWVEKYDHIAAPWNRSRFEADFYRKAATLPGVGDRMPTLLGSDPAAQILLLEALPDSSDLMTAYSRSPAQSEPSTLSHSEIEELAQYLAALHTGTHGLSETRFSNREMRQLNFEHIFVIPFQEDNGLDLEALESGLQAEVSALRNDRELMQAVQETGENYRNREVCLVHGDYYPGSWLRSSLGLRIIDAEFGFPGEPEVDLGCAVAHFALAQEPWTQTKAFLDAYQDIAPVAAFRNRAVARYAATEVIRRIIGVAQLPIPTSPASGPAQNRRKDLLHQAHRVMLGEEAEQLFAATATRL